MQLQKFYCNSYTTHSTLLLNLLMDSYLSRLIFSKTFHPYSTLIPPDKEG